MAGGEVEVEVGLTLLVEVEVVGVDFAAIGKPELIDVSAVEMIRDESE